MNLKRHIVKIICFALDRGGEEIKVTFLHVKVNTNQQRKHHVIWFKSLMLQGEVTWSSCVLIRLPFWRNYGDYGIWLGLFICLLIAWPAELDGRGPTVCLRVNTHPENGLKSEKSFSSTWEFKSLIAKLKALQSLHQNEQCRHIRKQRWNDDENATFTLSLILNYWTAGWLFTAEGSESLCVSVCQTVTASSQLLTFCRHVYHAFFWVFIVLQPPQLNSIHYFALALHTAGPSEEQQQCCFSFHAEATVTVTSV